MAELSTAGQTRSSGSEISATHLVISPVPDAGAQEFPRTHHVIVQMKTRTVSQTDWLILHYLNWVHTFAAVDNHWTFGFLFFVFCSHHLQGLNHHVSFTDSVGGASRSLRFCSKGIKPTQWGTLSTDPIRQVSPRKISRGNIHFSRSAQICNSMATVSDSPLSPTWREWLMARVTFPPCCTCPHANVTELFTAVFGLVDTVALPPPNRIGVVAMQN